jgi:hypothetical protein
MPEVVPQKAANLPAREVVPSALEHLVVELRVEIKLRREGELQQLHPTVGKLDPALEDRSLLLFGLRRPSLPGRHFPSRLGHG